MPTIQVNDIEFYYELHGKGHPLVLISGYTSDHQNWIPYIELLKDKFQLLLFDNQGVGQTKDHGGPLSAEDMADGIMGLATALDLNKPHVVGVSMGGTIAQCIGSRYGDQIDKLALIVSTAKWRQAMLRGLKAPLAMREKELDFDDIFNAQLAWVMGEEFLLDPERIQEVKELVLANPFPQTLEDQKRQYEVLTQFDGRDSLHLIEVPTLILYTTEDIIALPFEAQFMADKIPHSTLLECAGGHGVMMENPQLVADHFKRFF